VISDGANTGTGEKPDATKIDFTITMRQKRDEPAPAPRGDAAEQPPAVVDDTGFSGVWSINLTSERMRRPMPAVLTLQREGDVITGSFRSRDNEYVLKNGHYDAAKGEATAEYVGSSSGDSTLTASVEGDAITGTVRNERFSAEFTGVRGEIDPEVAERARDEADFEMPPEALNHPLGEYGLAEAPQPQTVLVTGATLWTCGPEGIVQNGWMLVRDGKIAQMGAGGWPRIGVDAVIDAAGKHITPGLIDCHSHTGIDGGVNEGHQANTAEVRIGDCIDPDDINWYRELAGGLTACNQLHGSANPIGGQNSVVKLKWGRPASAYPIQGAIAGIKFALGENVVRSQGRYPNTRMGVETFIRDAFTAARDYEAEHARYAALGADEKARTMPPRRDLELDALVEILHGERLVHCHSYRQDEILMLIRLAEQFGFRIGTFQHVLEGYKVADAIAAHGAGASSFSDWWAYKVEVMDAIPYNGAILHDVGAVVSFNSDSNELARRMNTEAAKAVRYGGLSPEEALKFVTLNPARQLRIDDRVGSLEVGKDADFVIWSGDPLSTYTRCEQTWIEGARYFDLETDARLRAEAQSERQRLAQKILAQTHGKKPSLAPSTPPEAGPDEVAPPGSTEEGPDRPTTCAAHADARASSGAPDESMPLLARMMEARRKWMEEQVRLGRDPAEMSPGDCGCGGAADLYFMMGGY
jgi:N-acetylglucosamine-6-phosphate deacetylase